MKGKIKGLTEAEIRNSYEKYGDNSLKREKRKGIVRRFLENLSDPIIRILMIALTLEVVLTLGHCNYVEIGGILAAIFISAGVSTASEYRSERAFERLEAEYSGTTVSVLRSGAIMRIDPASLVVGDVVYISAGEAVHADGTVIEGRVSVDQSALNGESAECTKCVGSDVGWDLSAPSRLFRGSVVTDGSCIMEVGRVGGATYYGMVARDLQTETRESPLKHRLTHLAKQVSRIGYVAAGAVGIAYLFNTLVVDNGFVAERILASVSDIRGLFSILVRALTMMITVVVVAAPEGLPMMITVVLSANMKRMLRDNIHVKKLVGIDTAGSLNILFTDKTGTLTHGRPELDRIVTADGSFRSVSALRRSGAIYSALCISAHYNTDVVRLGDGLTGGNSTDRCIYSYFIDEPCERVAVVDRIPFTSERKYSQVTLKNGVSVIKGAAELILKRCNRMLTSSGERALIARDALFREYTEAAGRGERVVAVALADSGESDAVLVGLLVMRDKLRGDVADSVREVTRAGIQTVMVTGDSLETAVAIASECGIYRTAAGHVALDSACMHLMTDSELRNIIPRLRVVARALPQDKLRLVRLSQEEGLVVGMTGDGINDAPSLKLADVGFAMGSGTDIAKSAADIVILDNSFSAIVKTALYGRTIFKSIRKFITFQLIMNLVACGISLVGQFIGIDTPITIIQMLWINIIMDTLGGLAFAGEAPLDYYMREMPTSRDEPILTRDMLFHILFSGLFTLGISVLFLTSYVFRDVYGYSLDSEKFYTAFYALFIFAGLFNCLATRTERFNLFSNIGKNKPFIFIMLLISGIQIAMIYFGGELFRCTPLSPRELLFAIGVAFTVVPFDIIRRTFEKLR